MNKATEKVRKQLFSMQDEKYKAFQCKLMPDVDRETVIGVRTPELRKYAKEFSQTPYAEIFLDSLPHKYYEENNLHSFVIENIKDFDTALFRVDEFLPYVDNWATCDSMSPKVFGKNKDKLLPKIKEWLSSDMTYTVRFAMEMLMCWYLDDDFSPEYPEMVASVRKSEYYVNMMAAWYFATALAKQYDSVIGYLEDKKLDVWTHNKTIQKAIESYRITDEQKEYLRTLKIK